MDLKESIGIFTDSSSDLSRASALKYDVGILPIQLTVGNRTLWEHYDVTAEEYWTMLEQAEETPKTAQVALVAFQGVYERAKKQGCTHLLGILINGGGSGTFNAACTARDRKSVV